MTYPPLHFENEAINFLKENGYDNTQQSVEPYGKNKPYENRQHEAELPDILEVVRDNKYNKPGTDAVTIESNDHKVVYLIDHSAHSELEANIKEGGDGFGIRASYQVDKITENDIKEIIRNIAVDYRGSKTSIQHRLQELGIKPEDLSGIDIDAAIQRGIRDNGALDDETRKGTTINNRSGLNSGKNQRVLSEIEGLDFFSTSFGEVYGFIDPKTLHMYLDEDKITPEHPLHEYTHIWGILDFTISSLTYCARSHAESLLVFWWEK